MFILIFQGFAYIESLVNAYAASGCIDVIDASESGLMDVIV